MNTGNLVGGASVSGSVEACAKALEPYHLDLVSKAVDSGWSEHDVATGLLWLAVLHLELLRGRASELSDVQHAIVTFLGT